MRDGGAAEGIVQGKDAWILGISGASGAVYGLRLLELLSRDPCGVDLIVSAEARYVIRRETGLDLPDDPAAWPGLLAARGVETGRLACYRASDFRAPPASGSRPSRGMVIAPCSMGTVAALAHGLADNLMRRAADVALKQRRPLVLVPRETPLSTLHLENLLALARLGAVILPPMPAYYHGPSGIPDLVDYVVGRILEVLGIPHDLYPPWPG